MIIEINIKYENNKTYIVAHLKEGDYYKVFNGKKDKFQVMEHFRKKGIYGPFGFSFNWCDL